MNRIVICDVSATQALMLGLAHASPPAAGTLLDAFAAGPASFCQEATVERGGYLNLFSQFPVW